MTAAKLYRVTRLCCRSGCCIVCRAAERGGNRKRIVQADKLSESTAKRYVEGWSEFDPKMEPMTGKAAP